MSAWLQATYVIMWQHFKHLSRNTNPLVLTAVDVIFSPCSLTTCGEAGPARKHFLFPPLWSGQLFFPFLVGGQPFRIWSNVQQKTQGPYLEFGAAPYSRSKSLATPLIDTDIVTDIDTDVTDIVTCTEALRGLAPGARQTSPGANLCVPEPAQWFWYFDPEI